MAGLVGATGDAAWLAPAAVDESAFEGTLAFGDPSDVPPPLPLVPTLPLTFTDIPALPPVSEAPAPEPAPEAPAQPEEPAPEPNAPAPAEPAPAEPADPVPAEPAPAPAEPAPAEPAPAPAEAAPPPAEPVPAPAEPAPAPAEQSVDAQLAARGLKVSAVARKYVGAPYRYGAEGPRAFDCSGLTRFVYRQFGIALPHKASAQFSERYGRRIRSIDALQPGDLVFFANTAGRGITHTAIYVGNGKMVTANTPRTGVRLDSIHSSYWRRHWAGAIRPRL